jgi:hypothetical protein
MKLGLLVVTAVTIAVCSSPVTLAVPAASHNSNPLVDVVVDATPAHCTLARIRNATSSSSNPTQIPCAPYTLAKSVTMTRSEAVTKSLQYVLRPDQSAPASSWQQETVALSQIASNQRSAHASQVQPLSCSWGGAWSQDEGWPTINSDNLALSISWFTTSDCTGVYLQTAVVRGLTSPKALYLEYESYEICCPVPVWTFDAYIGTNTFTKHLPGNTWKYPTGGDFEYEFSTQSLGGTLWWYDLGPLN